jgi:hypothetical protein
MTMFGIIGSVLEKGSDMLGLPESVGDALKIGASILTADPIGVAEGSADLLEDVVDLGPGGEKLLQLAQMFLGGGQGGEGAAGNLLGSLLGGGQGSGEGGADLGGALLDNILQAMLSRKG